VRVVSPILKRIVYPGLCSAGYFSFAARSGLAVITYHGVLPPGYRLVDPVFDGSLITPETFRQQLRLLKKKYTVVSPEEIRVWCRDGGELPWRAVLLTCDDGCLSNLTDMLPILQDEGLRCLFFVTGASTVNSRSMLWYEDLLLLFLRAPAGRFSISAEGMEISAFLDNVHQRRREWWNAVKRLSTVDPQTRQKILEALCSRFGLENSWTFFRSTYPQSERHFGLLTGSEVQELAAAGMTIGAHTMSHPILSQLPPELVRWEIIESKIQLESLLGSEIWAFAYPFGDLNSVTPDVVHVTKQLGLEAAFLNSGGGLGADLPRHALPRVHVNAGMDLAEFEAHVSGFYEGMKRLVGRPSGFGRSILEPVRSTYSTAEVPLTERASHSY
jgi:peptidoglycan/xylan/chitin deacetylase (PgdA/CDA1 family)